MVEVRERKTDWIGVLREIFGSVENKNEADTYSKWEQENKTEIEGTNSRIKRLIAETTSSNERKRRVKSKSVVKKVEPTNINTKNVGEVSVTKAVEKEIEK